MAISRQILFFLTLCHYGLSLPVNCTEPSYKSDPEGRGTISLLWSCTITFGLCLWSAFHPNIVPPPRKRDTLYLKLCSIFASALFPEFMVAFAFCQWKEARKIRQAWERAFPDQPRKDWLGMPGAFFVLMGGYVVKKDKAVGDKEGENVFITIRPAGFKELLEKGVLHSSIDRGLLTEAHFSSDNIQDKGKADGIAKFLVTWQILWMAIQCLGRKLNGLPVTLLECHILVQIPYSIAAYICWWDKPLDVAEPIVLTLYNSKEQSPKQSPEQSTKQSAGQSLQKSPHPKQSLERSPEQSTKQLAEQSPEQSLDPKQSTEQSDVYTDIQSTNRDFLFNKKYFIKQRDDAGNYNAIFHALYDCLDSFLYEFEEGIGNMLEACSAALAVINGSLHGIAWNSHFPTVTEKLLWRVSSIGTGLFPLLGFILTLDRGVPTYFTWTLYEGAFCGKSLRQLMRDWTVRIIYSHRPKGLSDKKTMGLPERLPVWVPCLHLGMCILCLLGYVGSIGYLTIEAYVSVRSLPKGAYSSVEWSTFFPHF